MPNLLRTYFDEGGRSNLLTREEEVELSKKIEKVWVSSDNKKIINISKQYGANIIKRPKKISIDI